MPTHRTQRPGCRDAADLMNRAMGFIKEVTPGAGTYSTEADYFLEDWQQNQWGANYPGFCASNANTTRVTSSGCTTAWAVRNSDPE